MKSHGRRLALVAAAGVLLSACGSGESQTSAAEVVARVNGEPIVLGDLVQAGAQTRETMRGRVDAAVARHLAAGEATRRGLSGSTPSEAPLSVREEEELRDALFASMRDSLELSEQELRDHYEKTRVRYVSPQVALRRQPFASEAEARAEDARLGREGRIAADGSERIGPAPVEDLPASVMPEALTLAAAGQRVVLVRDGRWWLVELEEALPAEPLPFEAVRARVEQSLRLLRAQAEFGAEINRLRSEAQIAVDDAALGADR